MPQPPKEKPAYLYPLFIYMYPASLFVVAFVAYSSNYTSLFMYECIREFVCLSVLQYFKYPLIIHRPASQWDGRKVIKTLETADKTDFMPIDTHTTKPEKPSNKSKNPRRSILLFIFTLFSLLFLLPPLF